MEEDGGEGINKEGNKWTERKHGVWRVRGGRCYGGYGNDGRRGYGEGRT